MESDTATAEQIRTANAAALEEAKKLAGGVGALGRLFDPPITGQAFLQGRVGPPLGMLAVERDTGVPQWKLRRDPYLPPESKSPPTVWFSHHRGDKKAASSPENEQNRGVVS
jgi:hypothetical protein